MRHSSHRFNRLVCWLILVCFYFQSLWPSVVFAADMEVMRLVSSSAIFGRALPEGDVLREESSSAFVVHVDDQDEAFDLSKKGPAAFIPLGKSLEETQKLIDEDLSLQALYPGLKVQTEGLAWTNYGYSLFLHQSGNLLVSANRAEGVRSSVLRLYNPYGSVVLGKDLALEQLWVKAHHVIQTGNNSIKRLDVWATGDSSSPGTFTNSKETSLTVREFYLHQGQSENHGFISIEKNGLMDLKGHDLFNDGNLDIASNSRIINARLFGNLGFIGGKSYSISARVFHNSRTMKGELLRLFASQQFSNSGDIHSAFLTEVVSLKDLNNSGIIASDVGQVLTIQGDFANSKTVDAPNQRVKVVGKTENSGFIKGQDFLNLDLNDGFNTGDILSEGDAETVWRGNFVNQKVVLIKGKQTLTIHKSFTNTEDGKLIGESAFEILGKGNLTNKGIVRSYETIKGFLEKLVNRGVFKADKGFQNLTIAEFFSDTMGAMVGSGTVRLQGINFGQWLADNLVLDLIGEFSHAQGALQITEAFSTKGVGKFLVHSAIESLKVFINNSYFENFSEWIQHQMIVEVGPNVTSWRNGNLEKDNKRAAMVVKSLQLEKSVALDSVIFNDGSLKVSHFTNHHQSFRNKGNMTLIQWQQRGNSFSNQKGGAIDCTELTDIDMDSFENEAQITLAGVIKGRLDQIHNKGKITLEGPATLTGVRLLNEGIFRTLALFDWYGEIVENRDKLLIDNNHIRAAKQFINFGTFRWTHQAVGTRHLLNLGWMEKTDALDSLIPVFTLPEDQTTDLKTGPVVENRGTILMVSSYDTQPTDTTGTNPFRIWINTGTMKLRNLKLAARRFQNSGILELEQSLTGNSEIFENTGKLISKESFTLTGQLLSNTGTIQAEKGITYNGKTITSTDTAAFSAPKGALAFTTLDALKLEGEVFGWSGATISAPSIENLAKTRIEEGRANFKGILVNRADLDVNELVYEGNSLVNSGLIEANLYRRSSLLQNLINQADGKIVVREGEFRTKSLQNRGKLELDKGLYTFEFWDNESGDAAIDRFSILDAFPIFKGTLDVTTFVPGISDHYDTITVQGNTTIRDGNFRALQLENQGQFTLEKGSYSVAGYLINKKGAKLTLSQKMIRATNINNDGEVVVSGDLKWEGVRDYYLNLGQFEIAGDLILDFAESENPARFLQRTSSFKVGKAYRITSSLFSGVEVTVPNFVFLKTKKFTNPFSTLEFNGLELIAEEFSNGESNERMGKMNIFGPLTLISKESLDNRFGVIKVKGTTLLRSLKGDVYVGERITKRTEYDQRCWDGMMVYYNFHHRNGAKVTSTEDLTIDSLKAGIYCQFGALCTTGKCTLRSPTKVVNLAGIIKSKGWTSIEAPVYQNQLSPRETVYSKNWAGHQDSWYYHRYYMLTSDQPELVSLSSIFFDSPQITNEGGIIRSAYNIFSHKRETYTERNRFIHNQTVDQEHGWYSDQNIRWGQAADYIHGYGKDKPALALVQAGDTIYMDTDDFLSTGPMNGNIVRVIGDTVRTKNPTQKRETKRALEALLINLAYTAIEEAAKDPSFKVALAVGQGISMDMLEDEEIVSDAYNEMVLVPSYIPRPLERKVINFIFSPAAFYFTLLSALGNKFGALHLDRKFGMDLYIELFSKGKKAQRTLADKGLPMTKEAIIALEEALLFQEVEEFEGQLYRVPKLLLPHETQDLLRFEPGATTGNDVHTHARKELTLEGSAVNGTYAAKVTSDGTMKLLRDKKTIARREGNKTIVEETIAAPALIQSPEGTVDVVATDTIVAQAPHLKAKDDVNVESEKGSLQIEEVIATKTEDWQESYSLGRQRVIETHHHTSQTVEGMVVNSKEGAANFTATEEKIGIVLPTVQTLKGINFTTRQLDLRGTVLQETHDMQQTVTGGGSRRGFWGSLFGIGGAITRSASSHIQTASFHKGELSTAGSIKVNGEKAVLKGIDCTWGDTFYDHTKQLDILPLEGTSESSRSEGRVGWKGNAYSQTTVRDHAVIPSFMQGRYLHLKNQYDDTKGETHLRSVLMHVDASLIHKAVRESTAIGWTEVAATSTSSGGKALAIPRVPFTTPRIVGSNPMDRASSLLEGVAANAGSANTLLKIMNGDYNTPLAWAQLIGSHVGTYSHTTGSQSRYDYQSQDVPNQIYWGDLALIDIPSLHLKGFNTVRTLTGTVGQLSAEPLQQVKIFDVKGQSTTRSANGFSLSFGHSESRYHQHSEAYLHTNSTFHIEEDGDLTVEKDADLTGLKVTGKFLDLEVMGNLTGTSVPDVYEEHSEQSHSGVNVSFAAPLTAAMTGNPMGFLGAVSMANISFGGETRDVRRTAVGDRAGIDMSEHPRIKVHGHLSQASFDIKGPDENTRVEAGSRSVQEIATTESITESHDQFGSALRLLNAGITVTQISGELIETLNRTWAKDKIKEQVYNQAIEEGAESGEAIEVVAEAEKLIDAKTSTDTSTKTKVKRKLSTKRDNSSRRSVDDSEIRSFYTSLDESTVSNPYAEVYGRGRTRMREEISPRARSLSPYSQTLVDAIGQYQKSIEVERNLRAQTDTGIIDKAKSYMREWGIRQAQGDAGKLYQDRQMAKGLSNLATGQGTRRDLYDVGMGISGVAIGAIINKGSGGGKGTGVSIKGQMRGIGTATHTTKGKIIQRPLLPGEGKVGTFKELDKIGRKGDNLTPDHMPQSAYMKSYKISHEDGIAMMIEHPVPGIGGRHRMTRTYGKQPNLNATPREELARDIADRRNIYRGQNAYSYEIHKGLQEVIEKNKKLYPNLFNKGKK